MMKECCGTCAWHKNFDGSDFICTNEESDCNGAVTNYNDCCMDYEEKE